MKRKLRRLRNMSSILLVFAFLLNLLVLPVGAAVTTDDTGMKVTLDYQPGSIVMDMDGSIYVGDWSGGNMYKFKADGTVDTSWGNGGSAKWTGNNARGTCGMCLTPDGNIVITGQSNYIFLVEKTTGTILKQISANHPLGVTADVNGNIFVASNDGVTKYDSQLNLIANKNVGAMAYGIAVDPQGRIYYTTFSQNIFRLNPDLTADTSFGTNGSVAAFNSLAGGLYYCDGNLYGSSEADYMIKKIDTNGQNVETIISGTGPNNIFITDGYYVVPFWRGSYFQIFKRPKINVAEDHFQASLNPTSLPVGSTESLTLTITSDSTKNYGVTAKVYDKNTGAVVSGVTASTEALVNGGATITISAPAGGWQKGEYSFQVIFTAQLGGITLSDSLQISQEIQVGSMSLLTFTTDVQNASVGKPMTLTANMAEGKTGTVTFKANGTVIGTADIADGKATCEYTPSSAGSLSLTAEYGAEGSAESKELTFTVAKGTQTNFKFDSVSDSLQYGDPSFQVTASGNQGTGAVTYSSTNTSVLTVDPATGLVTIQGVGTATIKATVDGDSNYEGATIESSAITVGKATQTEVDFGNTPSSSLTYGDASFSAALTGVKSTGSVTYSSSDPSVLSVDPATGEVTIVGAGTAKIIVTVAADKNYEEATIESPVITVNKATQTGVAFENTPAATATYGDGSFSAAVTGGQSTGGVTYSSTNPSVLSVDPATGLVTIKGAGSAKITATKAGDTNYEESGISTDLITVQKAALKVTVADASANYGQDAPNFTVQVTGFVNGESADTLAGFVVPTASCTDTTAGTHAIVVSGGNATDNYAFTYVNGSYTINEVTATSNDYSVAGETAGWNTSDVVITPSGEYTKIWDGTTWADKLVIAEGHENPVNFKLKKADGTETKEVTLGTIQVDTTAPTVQSVSLNSSAVAQKSSDAITYDQYFKDGVTLDIHAQDATSGIKTVEYQFVSKGSSLDDNAWATYSADNKPTQVPGFAGYLAVRVTDEAGNQSIQYFGGFTVDNTAPVITGVDNNGSYYVGKQIHITDESGEALSGTYTKDGGDETAFHDGDVLTEVGSYVIKVMDKSGNTAIRNITIKPLPGEQDLDSSDASLNLVNSIRKEYNDSQSYLPEPYKTDINNTITALEERIQELRIKIVDDAQTGISVEGVGDTDFDSNTTLLVENVTDNISQDTAQQYNSNIQIVSKDKQLVQLYDLKLMLDGQPIQPDGKVKIRIKMTEEMKNYSDLQVVYIDDAGNTQIMESEIDGDFIVFYTDHFSHYGVIGTPAQQNPKTGDSSPVAGMAVLSALMVVTVCFLRKKQKDQ